MDNNWLKNEIDYLSDKLTKPLHLIVKINKLLMLSLRNSIFN